MEGEKTELEAEKKQLELDKLKLEEETEKLEKEKQERDQKIGSLTEEQMKLLDEYKSVKVELQKFMKAAKFAEKVSIQYKTDFPLRLDFRSNAEMTFILAPRVEEED